MSVLLNLVLLSVLGVLQVSCAEINKSVEITTVINEVKCGEKLKSLFGNIPSYLTTLKGDLDFKTRNINTCEKAQETFNKCACGKEIEDKKCQEETIGALQLVVKATKEYLGGFAGNYISTINKIILLLTETANELSCCCKKVDFCVKKFDIPSGKYKDKKECKEEKCDKSVVELHNLIYNFIVDLSVSMNLADTIIKEFETLLKLKDEGLKDGFCQNEQLVLKVSQHVQALQLYLSYYVSLQVHITFADDFPMLAYSEIGQKEITTCGKEKKETTTSSKEKKETTTSSKEKKE